MRIKLSAFIPYHGNHGRKSVEQLKKMLSRYASWGPPFRYDRTGYGLMQGLEFKTSGMRPDSGSRNHVLRKLFAAEPMGIVTVGTGIDAINSIIRFEPPLTISEADIEYLDAALEKILNDIYQIKTPPYRQGYFFTSWCGINFFR